MIHSESEGIRASHDRDDDDDDDDGGFDNVCPLSGAIVLTDSVIDHL